MTDYYVYQTDDDRITAVALAAVTAPPLEDLMGAPLADGEPVPAEVAMGLIRRFGGQLIDATGIRTIEPESA